VIVPRLGKLCQAMSPDSPIFQLFSALLCEDLSALCGLEDLAVGATQRKVRLVVKRFLVGIARSKASNQNACIGYASNSPLSFRLCGVAGRLSNKLTLPQKSRRSRRQNTIICRPLRGLFFNGDRVPALKRWATRIPSASRTILLRQSLSSI
jgi:hypothetical protein